MEKGQKIIIDRINELCLERNMSYYVLAYRSAVPQTTLSNIMHGISKNPGILTIFKICDGLGISPAEFFNTNDFLELAENE